MLVSATLAASAACTSASENRQRILAGASSAQPTAPLARVAAAARRCWFAGGDRRFARHALVDERDSARPRLIAVAKADPQGKPALVIEPAAGGGVQVYGPLATPAVRAEARAFAAGRTECRR